MDAATTPAGDTVLYKSDNFSLLALVLAQCSNFLSIH